MLSTYMVGRVGWEGAGDVKLLEPVRVGGHSARNRVLFGPHVTNLGRQRSFSDRHVAYYDRRAAGGCGTVVLETASVHDSDWSYERAPLAADAGPAWRAIASALHDRGTLAIASLGHAGGQGSSAYHQRALWAPSGIADPISREVAMEMGEEEIGAVVEGFCSAATLAGSCGMDGVEVDAGPVSLVRQFLSALSNSRSDGYGADRTRFAREVLDVVKTGLGASAGPGAIVGLRLSCDELAPWAGITPEEAAGALSRLAPLVDYVVGVRGGPYEPGAGRPDGHVEAGFGVVTAAALRAALPPRVVVVAQGSLVEAGAAERALLDAGADMVEMTRAQIADAELVVKLAAGRATTVRPCVLCNQRCQVRDVRNPIVSCIGDPD
ncbi:MAG: hypothetical protein ACRDYD_14435, partial [Acidimicrobiales bacterium]